MKTAFFTLLSAIPFLYFGQSAGVSGNPVGDGPGGAVTYTVPQQKSCLRTADYLTFGIAGQTKYKITYPIANKYGPVNSTIKNFAFYGGTNKMTIS